MRELFFEGGRPFWKDVPPPGLARGRVLVEVHYSAISPGTEISILRESGKSFLALALEKRRRVDRLVDALRRRDMADIRARFQRLAARRAAWLAPGYSAAGIVTAVEGSDSSFSPGDRVAIVGAGHATHAETASVPKNLVVPVPHELDLAHAATGALGAIALQGVRRAGSAIGETVVVLGLGMIGQITARILVASGCHVLVWDPDRARLALAEAAGASAISADATAEVPGRVHARTGGRGADQAIVTAGGDGLVVEAAARCVRRSGVLVLVGNTPVAVDRSTAYERELTVRVSTSYGPGRYDPLYEEGGQDYPFTQVRWTENRNVHAYLELLASGRVELGKTLLAVTTLDEAIDAYARLRGGTLPQPGLVVRYPAAGARGERSVERAQAAAPTSTGARAGIVRVAVLGTGGYAARMILPILARNVPQVRLELLAGNDPARREPLAQRFGFARTTADHLAAAGDPEIDLVVIATRHDRHAALCVRALEAGRAVFCEKPLALTREQLDRIEGAVAASSGFLAVGFNRRFAPAAVRLRAELRGRRAPLLISARVQAGVLPPEHWIHGAQGGGRLIGEACHFVDLLRFVAGAPLVRAQVLPCGGAGPEDPASDNFHLGLVYADGSAATLLYTSRGAPGHPKERIEVHGEGRSFELDDFVELRESGRRGALVRSPSPRKGQEELWKACIEAWIAGEPSPVPLPEILETSHAVIALEQARRGAL